MHRSIAALIVTGITCAAGAAPPPPKFDVRPSSFSSNCYVNFDETGKVNNQNFNCSLQMLVIYDRELTPVGYKDLKVTQIITDSGVKLAPVETGSSSQVFYSNRMRRGDRQPRFNFGVQLPYPPADARKLAVVAGQMTVQVGAGPVRQVTFPPMKEAHGKRVRVEGMAENVSLAIYNDAQQDPNNSRVRLELAQPAAVLIADVRFLDAQGRDLGGRESGYGSSNNVYTYYFTLRMPDDGRVVLSFYDHVEEVPVPFLVRDIPLPNPAPAKAEELVLHAVDPADAPAPAPDAAGDEKPAQENKPLNVIIER